VQEAEMESVLELAPEEESVMVEKPKRGQMVTYPMAKLETRLVAFLIDMILLSILSVVIAMILGVGEAGFIFYLLIAIAYEWYFLVYHNGQTPGKKHMKLRVIKSDGTPLTPTDAIFRAVGMQINNVCFGIGWLWAFWDDKRQGWHDKLAKTYVIENEPI
jgi:uncharacterized RDD family membrane protein YckC